MALSEEQARRYARQLALPELGAAGQEKLLASRVLILGAGGLGSPAALYLAAAGVGTLGIVDGDEAELSNLQRQILYRAADLGRPKAEAAAESLRALDPGLTVVPYPLRADAETLPALLADCDLVLDCTDRLETKLLIGDACVRAGKPCCHASVAGFYGQLLSYLPGRGPCFRCVFGAAPNALDARETGVLGAAAGALGCLQAAEAVKLLLGAGDALAGQLLSCDLRSMDFQKIPVKRDPNCPACGGAK